MPVMTSLHILSLILLGLSIISDAQTTHTTLTTTATRQPTTLTSIITTSTSTTVAPSASSDSSWTNDSRFEAACINSTNTYRAQHGASPVAWNDTLATWATRWANKCEWLHSGLDFGENLAEGFDNVADAVDGWDDERNMFDFSDPHFTKQTGHFSQLVWKGTTTMGCGRTYCGALGQDRHSIIARDGIEAASGWMFVCEYWPRGNVEDEFSENVASQISNGDSTLGLIAGGGASEQGVIDQGRESSTVRWSARLHMFLAGFVLSMIMQIC